MIEEEFDGSAKEIGISGNIWLERDASAGDGLRTACDHAAARLSCLWSMGRDPLTNTVMLMGSYLIIKKDMAPDQVSVQAVVSSLSIAGSPRAFMKIDLGATLVEELCHSFVDRLPAKG